jgi:hypothetical protein
MRSRQCSYSGVLLRFGFERTAAALGAGLFAVHPVHVEAVANIVGRAEVLMTIFVLLGVLAYLNRALPCPVRALAVCGACALALLTKENGIALPALLVAGEMFAAGARAHGRPLLEQLRANTGIYIGLVAVIAGTSYCGTRSSAPWSSSTPPPTWWRSHRASDSPRRSPT